MKSVYFFILFLPSIISSGIYPNNNSIGDDNIFLENLNAHLKSLVGENRILVNVDLKNKTNIIITIFPLLKMENRIIKAIEFPIKYDTFIKSNLEIVFKPYKFTVTFSPAYDEKEYNLLLKKTQTRKLLTYFLIALIILISSAYFTQLFKKMKEEKLEKSLPDLLDHDNFHLFKLIQKALNSSSVKYLAKFNLNPDSFVKLVNKYPVKTPVLEYKFFGYYNYIYILAPIAFRTSSKKPLVDLDTIKIRPPVQSR